LDHLGVQAPCINLYGRLLPGITNVTDRARYYSFYPWLIWAFDQQGIVRYDDDFVDLFRRADCLFSMIAERHAYIQGDAYDQHAAGMVGANTLAAAVHKLGTADTIKLSDYAHRREDGTRYFKNKLGGLGQYYLGVLRELCIIDGDNRTGIKYTRQVGQPIAEHMDGGIDRKGFIEALHTDVLGPADLDALAAFCPCQLAASGPELEILGDLFFVRSLFYDVAALPRRRSLQSLLFLADALSTSDQRISESVFRACTYTGCLPDGRPWEVPEFLERNRRLWALYSRNELLAVAVQGLFFVLLDAYEESGLRFAAGHGLVQWFLTTSSAVSAMQEFGADSTFSALVRQTNAWLPALSDWGNQDHEMPLAESIIGWSWESSSEQNRNTILIASIRILLALAARTGPEKAGYEGVEFHDDYFHYYPINLQSFQFYSRNLWSTLTFTQFLGWLLEHWGIEVHLRVALRKLRGQSQSTFRIRPSDRGLEVIEPPGAVHTRPRFKQALTILKDLGSLAEDSSERWVPSDLGRDVMGMGNAA
jgi:hypothetical protein